MESLGRTLGGKVLGSLSLLLLTAGIGLAGIEAQAQAQEPLPATVVEIRWEGLRRIPRDTMNARIVTRTGDPFSQQALSRDLRAIWNTNWFEDVRVEYEDEDGDPSRKIVYFVVQERPTVRRILYEGNKSVLESDILERFRERRVGLTIESPYDPTRVRRAEVAIQQLLAERGRNFATVKHRTELIPPNYMVLTFEIDEGPKVKIGDINFEGNRALSDWALVRAMKLSRPLGIPPFLYFIPRSYHKEKVQQDMFFVTEKYRERGYMRVQVHEPEIRVRDTQPWLPLRMLPFWFKDGKAMDLRVRVDEGGRYRMGELTIRSEDEQEITLRDGTKVAIIGGELGGVGGFLIDNLKAGFPLREGELFNLALVRKSFEDYTNLFTDRGYINFNVSPDFDLDDEARVINLTLDFQLGKRFFVRRIEFSGNTTTRDKVIRRELLLEEGSVYSSRRWETSILRLNQLGYFEELKPENADIRRNAEDGTVDLFLKVRERGRNSIGFNGGTSGLFGSFIGLDYSTNNFLGLGETLTVSLQTGDRSSAFVLGFTEPYMFDRPLRFGATFTIRKFEFDQAREFGIISGRETTITDDQLRNRLLNYDQNTVGFSLSGSYPLRKFGFGQLGVSYAFSDSDITCASDACTDLFSGLAFRGLEGPSSLEGIQSSRVTTTYFYNTVNHPINPTAGKSIFLGASVEGGVLGGNQKTIRPSIEYKQFIPVNRRRNVIGFRVQAGFVTGYGGFVPSPFSRFFMGGEQDIRGFNIQQITPVVLIPRRTTTPVFFLDPTRPDANGNPTFRQVAVELLTQTFSFPGGDAQLVTNTEYRIPIVGPLEFAFFLDAGVNTILRPSQLRLRQTELEALRATFPDVNIADTLQTVPGTNSKIRSSAGAELVINLPIVQAPFRLYWAYNLSRINTTITQPGGVVVESAGFPLPPGVLENQIVPALDQSLLLQPRLIPFREPLRSFRFTISRTF